MCCLEQFRTNAHSTWWQYFLNFQKLKKQRDQLQQYQRRIESVLEKDRQLAKKLLNEGKREWENCTFWSITTQFSQSAKHEKMRRLEFLWAAQALLSSLAWLRRCIFCISSCYLTFCIKYLQIRTTKTTTLWAKTKRQDRLFIAQRGCDARFFVTD